MSWKKLKTNLLLSHPRIHIYEDDVVLPNGKESKYLYFGNIADTATVIAKNDDGLFLVQKEYAYPLDRWIYQLPGGALIDGDTPLDGALRELSEEANLTGDFTQIGSYITNNRRSTQQQHVFVAINLRKKDGTKDAEEAFEEHWLSEAQIDALIAEGEICIASALSSWQIYKATKKTLS